MPDFVPHAECARLVYSDFVDEESVFQQAQTQFEDLADLDSTNVETNEQVLIRRHSNEEILAKRYFHHKTATVRIVVFDRENHPMPPPSWPEFDPAWHDDSNE